jgi:hypothetical protein
MLFSPRQQHDVPRHFAGCQQAVRLGSPAQGKGSDPAPVSLAPP